MVNMSVMFDELSESRPVPNGNGSSHAARIPTAPSRTGVEAQQGIKAPSWLSKFAKEEWKRVAGVLAERGDLTEERIGLIAAYCAAIGTVRLCEMTLDSEGMTIEASNGVTRAHPLIQHKSQSTSVAMQLGKKLGLFHGASKRTDDSYSDLGI